MQQAAKRFWKPAIPLVWIVVRKMLSLGSKFLYGESMVLAQPRVQNGGWPQIRLRLRATFLA